MRGNSSIADGDIDQNSQTGKQEQAFKLCKIIWSGYTKFIRSQCNKARVIDSIYFGTFYKRESDNSYVCIHSGVKYPTDLQPVTNSENVEDVSFIPDNNLIQADVDHEHVQVNIKAIAQVCGCS